MKGTRHHKIRAPGRRDTGWRLGARRRDTARTWKPKRSLPATGLQVAGHRNYSPELVRWASRDPINEPGHSLLDSDSLGPEVSAIESRLALDWARLLAVAARAELAGLQQLGRELRVLAAELDAIRDRVASGRAGALEEAAQYLFVLDSPVCLVDPHGLNPKDKRYGLPDRFWRWYHRNRKRKGDRDLTRDEAERLRDQWEDLGKPGADGRDVKYWIELDIRPTCPPIPAPNPEVPRSTTVTLEGVLILVVIIVLLPVGA